MRRSLVWAPITAPALAGSTKIGSVSISVATPDLAAGGTNATVSVALGGVTTLRSSHHVRLYVNPASHPTKVAEGTWDGRTVHLISATFPQSYLNSTGNNTVKIELINDSGRAADIVRVDWTEDRLPAAVRRDQ